MIKYKDFILIFLNRNVNFTNGLRLICGKTKASKQKNINVT